MNNTDLKLQARDNGERFYNTGAPCKRGHTSKRYASTGQCVECQSGHSDRQLDKNQGMAGMHYHKPVRLLLGVELAQDVADALDDYMVVCAKTYLQHKGINTEALDARLSQARATGKPIRDVM
jgi:hypothetical protein